MNGWRPASAPSGAATLIVVVTAFVSKHALTGHADAGSFLSIAMLVIVMGGAAGWWLKQLAREASA